MQTHGIKTNPLLFSPIWRIIACIVTIQMVSALFVMNLQISGSTLLDAFYGAALSTPTGFIFGLIWQAIYSKNSIRENLIPINLVLFLSLAISAGATFLPISL